MFATFDSWLLKHFRRITSSDSFIPEIDGLRFLAITSVVLYHINGYLRIKVPSFAYESDNSRILAHIFTPIFSCGYQGVLLFFVISGFILSYPFTKFHLGIGPNLPYSKYIKRRLTRLEPPYIISTLILFFALLLIVKKTEISKLLPSVLASLTYSHNLFYPGEMPRVNCVLWSLEIEVQFYLIAPLICRIYFLINNYIWRRAIGLIFVSGWAAYAGKIPGRTLLNYGYLFVAGLVLCDIICTVGRGSGRLGGKKWLIIGAVLLGVLLRIDFNGTGSELLIASFPLLIVLFFMIVMLNPFWKMVFGSTIIVVIGGMCYSIYMLHWAVISLAGRFFLSVGRHLGPEGYLSVQIIGYVVAILLLSGLFFKLVERPCMRREWPRELRRWLLVHIRKDQGIAHENADSVQDGDGTGGEEAKRRGLDLRACQAGSLGCQEQNSPFRKDTEADK